MRILHIADTHLGYSAYNKLDTELGINVRELDIYSVFELFVDSALEDPPDLILHAGDLFDSVRPSNRSMAACLEQMLRLSKEGIPVVLISGNHSTPRLRETGSVFRLLDHLDHIYPIYKGKYEQLRVPELPEVCIHAVPHIGIDTELTACLDAFAPLKDAKYNIGLMHGAVVGVMEYRSGEFNEQTIPSGYLRPTFDYIALGHYHEFIKVEENAYYSGSTERFSFNEAVHKSKGYIELELENGERSIHFRELPTRPMLELTPVNCSEPHDDLTDLIVKKIEAVEPAGKIIRLKVNELPTGEYHTLDFRSIRRAHKDAVYYEQVNNVLLDSAVYSHGSSPKIDKLSLEFTQFLKGMPVEKLDKDRLEKMGLDYIYEEEA